MNKKRSLDMLCVPTLPSTCINKNEKKNKNVPFFRSDKSFESNGIFIRGNISFLSLCY